MDEATLVTSNLEVMRFHRPVGAVLDLEVSQDVLLGDRPDVVVDGPQDPFRAFGRKMDFVVHVVVVELEVVEWYENRADFLGAPPYLGSEKADFVSLRSVRRDVSGGVDEKNGFSFHFRICLEDDGQFLCLGFCGRFELAEVLSRHVLADHDDDDLRVW